MQNSTFGTWRPDPDRNLNLTSQVTNYGWSTKARGRSLQVTQSRKTGLVVKGVPDPAHRLRRWQGAVDRQQAGWTRRGVARILGELDHGR
jgi:hypothetical protein